MHKSQLTAFATASLKCDLCCIFAWRGRVCGAQLPLRPLHCYGSGGIIGNKKEPVFGKLANLGSVTQRDRSRFLGVVGERVRCTRKPIPETSPPRCDGVDDY